MSVLISSVIYYLDLSKVLIPFIKILIVLFLGIEPEFIPEIFLKRLPRFPYLCYP